MTQTSARVLLLSSLLLPFGIPAISHAAPEPSTPIAANGGTGGPKVTQEDKYFKETTLELGDGNKLIHTESKMTGYWTAGVQDSDGNYTQVASGNGSGTVQSNGYRPEPTPMNDDHITVLEGDGWTQTTINNQDGTATITTKHEDGRWSTATENASGQQNIVAQGDGKGNVRYPND